MAKIILNVKGMTCSACQVGLEKYLNKQKGIISANVNLVLAQASIEYADFLTVADLERFIDEAGFESGGVFNPTKIQDKKKTNIFQLVFLGILAILTLYISMAHMLNLPEIPILSNDKHPLNYALSLCCLTIPFLIYGFSIFKSGIKNIIHRTPNMDTLVTLGVFTSFIYSFINLLLIVKGQTSLVHNLYFESCVVIIYFIKLGRIIDSNSKEKTKEALQELVQITPTKALLKTKDGLKEVTIDEVVKKDILVCKPGMRIAVDGIITKGQAHIDESFILGESLPSKKEKGSKVVAGSINIDGYIEYEAVKIGKESTISEIVKLVVEATNTKAPVQRLADKISSYFVPTIIFLAILTFCGYLLFGFSLNESLSSFVSVLVVACPCSLGLATPLAVVVSLGTSAKKGILIKDSASLENIAKIDTVVFDKTGSLTYGNLQIENVINKSNLTDEEFLLKIASLEACCTHPIASAFKFYVDNNNLSLSKVKDFENITGIGLKGTIEDKEVYVGSEKLLAKLKIKEDKFLSIKKDELTNGANTLIYLIEDRKILGLVGISDVIRKEAPETLSSLKKNNKDLIMLTGDNVKTAQIIAKKLGIKKVIANVLPQEKTNYIKQLLKENKQVMMIGDGINDAPSLATSNVGVSFNSATDIAGDSADVILMNNNLQSINTLFNISKKTLKVIKQNLFWAFFYNICMIPIAIGFFKPFHLAMNPSIAGIAMTFSSLTVVFNSLRLKR